MDFSFLADYSSAFLTGVKYTLILSITSVFFGVIIGAILALMRISKNKILNSIATAYIEFMRGTPLLIQLYIIYALIPNTTSVTSKTLKIIAGVIALSLNSAAYVAEIIRAGIEGIDEGQMEASRSLGMNYWMSMRYIIIPQAFKNILPVLGNEFIAIIKESSVISVIGAAELMFSTNNVRAATYKVIEPLAVTAVLYFIITFTISKLMIRLERRLSVSDKGK